MKNEYEVRGEVTAIIINSLKYGRQETLISTNKLELIKEFTGTWFLYKNRKSLYVQGKLPRKNGEQKVIYLHRLLMNCPEGMVVDHFNHNTLDNTDSNLKVVTTAENRQNLNGAQSNSTSGLRRVSWNKSNSKWVVHITVDRIQKHIGYFKSLEEAELASIEARKKYMPFSKEASA